MQIKATATITAIAGMWVFEQILHLVLFSNLNFISAIIIRVRTMPETGSNKSDSAGTLAALHVFWSVSLIAFGYVLGRYD